MRKQVVVPVRRPAGPPRRTRPPARSPEWSPWIRRWSSSFTMTPSRSWTSTEAPERTRPSRVQARQLLAHQVPLVQQLPVGAVQPVEPELGRAAGAARDSRAARSTAVRMSSRSVSELRPWKHASGQVPGQPDPGREHEVARRARWRPASRSRRRSAGSGRSFQHPEPVPQLGRQLEVLGLHREAELLPQLGRGLIVGSGAARPGSA